MASLRSLLQEKVTPKYSGVTELNRTIAGTQMYFTGMCNGTVMDTNYCRNFACLWPIPAGSDYVTFEAWGGGGGGAGACCCGWGFPGGAGAYAKKTLDNTGGTYDLCPYDLFAAYRGCCSPVGSCGYRGCQSWVTGAGLTNFCAEGGAPGCFRCNMWTQMNLGICPSNVTTPACACYYGADYGVPGRPGMLQTDDCTANSCAYKMGIPNPGERSNDQNAYHFVRYSNFNDVPDDEVCHNSGGGLNSGGRGGAAVGMGSPTASAQSGNCYCGQGGGPGLIRVSYL